MVNWWTSWEKGLRSMQPQPPERKQLRKQDFSSNCYFTGGCRLGTAPHFAPENLGHVHREPLSSNRFWEAKDEVLGGWSATLTLPDYGRFARFPPAIEGKF